jgi:hypothetical protein
MSPWGVPNIIPFASTPKYDVTCHGILQNMETFYTVPLSDLLFNEPLKFIIL